MVSDPLAPKSDALDEKMSPAAPEKTGDPDAEFGGHEQRKALERKLLWKLDLRMSILVVIYILNYVCFRAYIERADPRTICSV